MNDISKKILENVINNIAVARVDFIFTNKDEKEVSVASSAKGANIKKPDWPNISGVAYVLESDEFFSDIEFVCKSDCEISVRMRSKDIRDENDKKKRVLYYVDYKAFSVNNRSLLEANKPVDHDKCIRFTINVKRNERVKFHVEWDLHTEGQDFLNLQKLPDSLIEKMYYRKREAQGSIDLPTFGSYCRQAAEGHADIVSKTDPVSCNKEINDFFERNKISYDPEYGWYDWMLEKAGNNLICYTVKQWCRLSNEDRLEGIDILFKNWSDNEGYIRIISSMIDIMKYNKEILADVFSEYFAVNKKERKTPRVIGTYYHEYCNGGVQRVLSRVMQLWIKLGYMVVFITDTEVSDDDYDLPEGVTRVRLDNQTDGNRRGKSLSYLIREYNIDTLVYHDYLNQNLLHDLLICKYLDVSFVLYYHSLFTQCLLLNYRRMYLLPRIARCADLMVVVNEVDKKFWGHFNGNVHIVMNPLVFDLNRIVETPKNNKNIIWVGRLDKYKRFEDPVFIMEKLVKKHNDAKLMIVGSDSSNLKKNYNILKDKIEELNLNDNVKLCGYQKDVEPFYEKASIFLLTSACEGYPMVIIEALSYGLPVVMYELPYLTIIRDNQSIISVEQGNTGKAAEALGALLDDEERIKELGGKARKYIEELYSNDKVERQWKEIFDSLVSTQYSIPDGDDVLQTILDTFKIRLDMT